MSRPGRWSAVSASRNIDVNYVEVCKREKDPYRFICWCRPPFPEGDSDDEAEYDWDDEDEESEFERGYDSDLEETESEDGSSWRNNRRASVCTTASRQQTKYDGGDKQMKRKRRCDGGMSCLCGEPADDYPNHKWITSWAGRQKFMRQIDMIYLRDPEVFDMYVTNDYAGYGFAEVLENLLLDFVEEDNNWREQWVVCEVIALLLFTDLSSDLIGIDDGRRVEDLILLAVRTFLAMLARLERQQLLSSTSELRNLGLIMSLWERIMGHLLVDFDLADIPRSFRVETVEIKGRDGQTHDFELDIAEFGEYIIGYAERHGIKLTDAPESKGVADKLPPPSDDDPWNTAAAYRKYMQHYGTGKDMRIGGDKLDLTTWSSERRKKASFSGRDPLSKREMDMLKKGMVLGFKT